MTQLRSSTRASRPRHFGRATPWIGALAVAIVHGIAPASSADAQRSPAAGRAGPAHARARVADGSSDATRAATLAVGQLTDVDPAVRVAAARTLDRIIPTLADSVRIGEIAPSVTHALSAETSREPAVALLALVATLGLSSPATATAIAPAIPTVVDRWRREIADLDAGRLWNTGDEATPATHALVALGPAAWPAVGGVARSLLGRPECQVRRAYGTEQLTGGVRVAAGCRSAIAVLASTSQRDNPETAAAVLRPYLGLVAPTRDVGVTAARGLARLGGAGERVLTDEAGGSDARRADNAVIGLAHVQTASAIDALVAALGVPSTADRPGAGGAEREMVRARAALTLGRVGMPLATPAISALAAYANRTPASSYQSDTRDAALAALRALRAGSHLDRDKAVLINEPTGFEAVGPLDGRTGEPIVPR